MQVRDVHPHLHAHTVRRHVLIIRDLVFRRAVVLSVRQALCVVAAVRVRAVEVPEEDNEI